MDAYQSMLAAFRRAHPMDQPNCRMQPGLLGLFLGFFHVCERKYHGLVEANVARVTLSRQHLGAEGMDAEHNKAVDQVSTPQHVGVLDAGVRQRGRECRDFWHDNAEYILSSVNFRVSEYFVFSLRRARRGPHCSLSKISDEQLGQRDTNMFC